MMKIGMFRKRVSVQAERQMADGAGGYALAWTTCATVWANIVPLSGREAIASGHQEGRLTHKVSMRWRKDSVITPDMRLLYGARVFNIRAVMNVGERDREALLLVEEGAAT